MKELLTDVRIRTLRAGDKPWKVSDEKGLFLLIQPSGAKLWRLKYGFAGKEQKLSLGQYPEVSLKEARRRRDEARRMLDDGRDPIAEKRAAEAAAATARANTFGALAFEYIEKMEADGLAPVTVSKARWIVGQLLPKLGKIGVSELSTAQVHQALRAIELRGLHETARRARSLASRIFRYAVLTGRAQFDPTTPLRGALKTPQVKHFSATFDPIRIGEILRAIDSYTGHPLTRIALQLLPHVFLRPGELRQAEWPEIDLERATWTIPALRMKMRKAHKLPLSQQSLRCLREAHALSASHRYIFGTVHGGTRPLSENTMTTALRRLGFGPEEITAHGFRAIASTLLNEARLWSPDAIERALAHKDQNQLRATYHRGDHWAERVQMAQWWSDHLDQLKQGS